LSSVMLVQVTKNNPYNFLEGLKINVCMLALKENAHHDSEKMEKLFHNADPFIALIVKINQLINKSSEHINFFISSLEKYKIESALKSELEAESDFIIIQDVYNKIRIPELLILLNQLKDYTGEKNIIGKKVVNQLMQLLDSSRKKLVTYINDEKKSGFYNKTRLIKRRYDEIIKRTNVGYKKYQNLSDQIKKAWDIN
jgi:hypothetical protein